MGWAVGWGGMGGGVGWDEEGWEVAKTIPWDTPCAVMMPTKWSPLSNWRPPWVPLFQPSLWRVSKMLLRKVDQLIFNT